MKQYLLSVWGDDTAEPPAPEILEQMYKDVDALNNEIKEAGAWVFAGGLLPSASATTVRLKGDDVLTTDGPYAETKEQLGGFWVIKANDLDEALEWAAKGTRACRWPVEVRPFQDDAEE